jgi:uncharacterized protein
LNRKKLDKEMKRVFKEYNPSHFQEKDNVIHLKVDGGTDFFNKFKEEKRDSASFYYHELEDNFTLKAKVKVNGNYFADAVFIMVRESPDKWIKLCLEYGKDGQYSVVSVVTAPWSDDANGEIVDGNECWLRITRNNNLFGLHYSLNGVYWRFVREVGVDMNANIYIGFGIQAPKSDGCDAQICYYEVSKNYITDFRTGI